MNHSNVFRLPQGDWKPLRIKEPPLPKAEPTPTKIRRNDDLPMDSEWMR